MGCAQAREEDARRRRLLLQVPLQLSGLHQSVRQPGAVRRHCRKDPAHAVWLQSLDVKQGAASYCSWVPEQESTAKPQKPSAPPKTAPPKKAPSRAKRAREQVNLSSQMDH